MKTTIAFFFETPAPSTTHYYDCYVAPPTVGTKVFVHHESKSMITGTVKKAETSYHSTGNITHLIFLEA
jgi:hypothetical protein